MTDDRRLTGKLLRAGAALVIILLAGGPLLAQTPGTTPADGAASRTIEEEYLSSQTTVGTLNVQLRSHNEELKLIALTSMEKQFQSGLLPADNETAFEALSYVLNEGVIHVTRGDEMPLHYYPRVRREAARIIALSTHEGVVPQLVTNVLRDPEPTVRAQALYSLGEIGADPDWKVSQAIAKRLLWEDLGEPDLGVVYAALVAAENIYADPDNRPHAATREMVMRVSVGGPYTQAIRNKALVLLGTM
jgi:hypothetical protein